MYFYQLDLSVASYDFSVASYDFSVPTVFLNGSVYRTSIIQSLLS